jgi:hypothetical protein
MTAGLIAARLVIKHTVRPTQDALLCRDMVSDAMLFSMPDSGVNKLSIVISGLCALSREPKKMFYGHEHVGTWRDFKAHDKTLIFAQS